MHSGPDYAAWTARLAAMSRYAAVLRSKLNPLVALSVTVGVLLGAGASCRPSEELTALPEPPVERLVELPIEAPSQSARPPRPPGTIVIDTSDVFRTLATLPEDDVPDQLRDWAVYGTLVQLGTDADRIAKALHRTSPLRLPYLEEIVRFDYGRGRRAIVGAEVLLFHDHDDPDPIATLGRLADRVRMETGEIPKTVKIFEVEPALEDGEILVRPKQTVQGGTLFTQDYGYHEATVNDEASLKQWLATIDDVTYARRRKGAIVLGGRRFPKSRTRGVSYDDIAVLYQAHAQLPDGKEPGFSLDPQWKMLQLATALEKIASDPYALLTEALAIAAQSASIPDDALTRRAKMARKVSHVFTPILADLQAVVPVGEKARVFNQVTLEFVSPYKSELARLAGRARRSSGVFGGYAQRAVLAEIEGLMDRLASDDSDGSVLVRTFGELAVADSGMQCARYDGLLQGTQVGMNLFYTDLLAKLWAVDARHSAPVMAVPGFKSVPRLRIAPTFQEEEQQLSSTRIWFGPSTEGLSRADAEGVVLFQHILARIYAAGSDPTKPDAESRPTESSRRMIGWWNHHYQQVADYEQAYHTQNQILKWSLLSGWMWEKGEGKFLAAAKPDRSQRFDRWFKSEADAGRLRYPHAVPFRPESEWLQGTECMDLLASYPFDQYGNGSSEYVMGGVSTGGRTFLKEATTLARSADPAVRRVPTVVSGTTRAAPSVEPLYKSAGLVQARATSTTQFRTGGAILDNVGDVALRYERKAPGTLRVAVRGKAKPIGEFAAEVKGPSVKVRWDAAELDRAQAAAASEAGLRVGPLPASGHLRSPIVLRGANQNSWILPSSRGGKAVRVTRGPPGQPASVRILPNDGKHAVTADTISPSQLADSLDGYAFQELTAAPGHANAGIPQALQRTFHGQAPPATARQIRISGIKGSSRDLTAYVTDDGRVFLPRPTDPIARAAWRDIDEAVGLTPRSLGRIAAESKTAGADAKVALDTIADVELPALLGQLEKADDPKVLATLAKQDPAKVAQLKAVAQEQADFFLATGDGVGAQRALAKLEALSGGPSPDLSIRQGLASLQRGKLREGLARLEPGLSGTISPAEKDVIARFIRAHGDDLDPVRAVLNRRMNGVVPDAPQAPPSASLGLDNGRIVTRAPFDRSAVRALDPAEKKRLVESLRAGEGKQHGPISVYADSSLRLNKADFMASPGESLEQISRMPHVRMEQLNPASLAAYRPTNLVDATSRRELRGIEIAATSSAGPTAPATVSPAPLLLIVRDCDRDNDGQKDQDCSP